MSDQELLDRLEFIEFRQDLLFENNDISRLLYELKVTHQQYKDIMDLMDKYRTKIERGEKVHHSTFEQEMYEFLPSDKRDYHHIGAADQCGQTIVNLR